MLFTYSPDTDTLDVRLRGPVERQLPEDVVSRGEPSGRIDSVRSETETYEADPSGQILAHYREEHLGGLTIEHASRRAPKVWEIESLRRPDAEDIHPEVRAITGLVPSDVDVEEEYGRHQLRKHSP